MNSFNALLTAHDPCPKWNRHPRSRTANSTMASRQGPSPTRASPDCCACSSAFPGVSCRSRCSDRIHPSAKHGAARGDERWGVAGSHGHRLCDRGFFFSAEPPLNSRRGCVDLPVPYAGEEKLTVRRALTVATRFPQPILQPHTKEHPVWTRFELF